MSDFFDEIHTFYQQKKFCDLRIVNLWPKDPNFCEKVSCHSLVVSSAIPKLVPILRQASDEGYSSEDISVIIVQNDCCTSIAEAVDSIYSSLCNETWDANGKNW